MSAPIGNKNAIGNSGGKTRNDRILASTVRNLALGKIREILEGEDTDFQRQVLLRLTANLLPRLKEGVVDDGAPLTIVFDNSFKK